MKEWLAQISVNAPVNEEENPHCHAPKYSAKPSLKSRGYNNNNNGPQNQLWDVQETHMAILVRCPKTFGYIVFNRKRTVIITNFTY